MSTNIVRSLHIANGFRVGLLLTALIVAASAPVAGQSLLDRPPNIQGTWVGSPGTVFFHTMHRFISSGPPARKLVQTPTFLMGGTLPGDVLVGANYSTNSAVVARIPNEWEFFARFAPLDQSDGAPMDVAIQTGFNQAALSWDGQVVAARDLGRMRLLVAARGFSNAFDEGAFRVALAGGAVIRLGEFVALAADYGTLVDRTDADGRAAWSGGVQLGIPYTPHTLSLHASNARSKTLEGASMGENSVRYGFEFTVPITLSRYFGSGAGSEPVQTQPAVGARVAAEVTMTNRLLFTPDTVRIAVGETVRWRNTSDLLHTVTADPSRAADQGNVSLPEGAAAFDSGNMQPGDTFEHTFTVPGTYLYFCVPHELAGMIGWVIVSDEGSNHDA